MTFHIDEDIAPIAEKLLLETALAQAGVHLDHVPEAKKKAAAADALEAAAGGSNDFLEVVRDVSEWLWAIASEDHHLGDPEDRHIRREQRLVVMRGVEPRRLEFGLAVGLYGRRDRFNVLPLASLPVRNWLTYARGLILHRMNGV